MVSTKSAREILGESEIKNKLKECFKKCAAGRQQLRKRVVSSMNVGLSKEEKLAFTNEIVGGVGRDDVSLCSIIAVDQLLRYEESIRAKPIDIVKERELEREYT